MRARLATRLRLVAVLTALLSVLAADASGQEPSADMVQAGKHFERGVTLYGETDYPAALVEFKRAYALVPNAAVLYNIGEAYFQLQDYASALATFTRYLTEAPPGGGHRAEVESDVEVLRGRVGHLTVTTVPSGADVFVDDQPAGRTPLDDRLVVTIGHRKVTASLAGGPASVRYVDVAADDNASVTFELSATAPEASPLPRAPEPALRSEPRPPKRAGAAWLTAGWVATGVLAAGAATAGTLALEESGALKTARDRFPVTASTLEEDSDRTRTFSILADAFTASAVVLGGITLVATLTARGSGSTERVARVAVTPRSVNVAVTF
jgi:hypothetical protein